MRHATSYRPLLERWLRAALVVCLMSTVVLVAVHQHHAAVPGHDCALCTAAHTPAVLAPAGALAQASTEAQQLLPTPVESSWDSDPVHTLRSRAPPLA